MAVTYNDLVPEWDTGINNMGGTQQVGFIGSIVDFETIQEPATSPVNVVDTHVVATAHVMKSGKKMTKVYTEQNKGEVSYDPLGSEDGGGFMATFKGFLPGDSKKANYMANVVRSTKFIAIVPDADGLMNQIGTEAFPATMKMGKKTQTNDGVKGYDVEISARMPWKLMYTAAVPLEVAD